MIRVTSGFRCAELNRAVGGAKNSQHTQGEAADIHVTGREMAGKMVLYLRMVVDFDQCIIEPRGTMEGKGPQPRWLHLSYRKGGRNRREVLR